MPIPHAEKLIELARKGHSLPTKDRRHCVGFLVSTKPDLTNSAMAELFQVSERQIREDKTRLRKLRADVIKEEDPGLVIADIAMCYDQQIRDMEASKAKCQLGSRTYLAHCQAILNSQFLKVKALQDLGYFPKHLGNLVIEKFEFKSTVTSDNTLKARSVNLNLDDEGGAIDAEYSEVKPGRGGFLAARRAAEPPNRNLGPEAEDHFPS